MAQARRLRQTEIIRLLNKSRKSVIEVDRLGNRNKETAKQIKRIVAYSFVLVKQISTIPGMKKRLNNNQFQRNLRLAHVCLHRLVQ